MSQPGFFDLDDRYAALSKARDPLERLGTLVNFEIFRVPLLRALRRSDGADLPWKLDGSINSGEGSIFLIPS